jgi:hypothetical protein
MAGGATVASAQQLCRTATGAAQRSVTRYLTTPAEHRWLRTHGITATRVEDLQPLVDANAGSVCVRMDSTLAPETGAYFRAGAYIIGTIAKPLVEGSPVHHVSSTIFVFDTLGVDVHQDGLRVFAPSDFRVSSVLGTRVVLAWSRSNEPLVGLQLQRASGGGAFADIGSLLAVTVTTTTDSTLVAGSSYRYRLAAVTAAGDSGYSYVVDVSVVDPDTITRSSSGRLPRIPSRGTSSFVELQRRGALPEGYRGSEESAHLSLPLAELDALAALLAGVIDQARRDGVVPGRRDDPSS